MPVKKKAGGKNAKNNTIVYDETHDLVGTKHSNGSIIVGVNETRQSGPNGMIKLTREIKLKNGNTKTEKEYVTRNDMALRDQAREEKLMRENPELAASQPAKSGKVRGRMKFVANKRTSTAGWNVIMGEEHKAKMALEERAKAEAAAGAQKAPEAEASSAVAGTTSVEAAPVVKQTDSSDQKPVPSPSSSPPPSAENVAEAEEEESEIPPETTTKTAEIAPPPDEPSAEEAVEEEPILVEETKPESPATTADTSPAEPDSPNNDDTEEELAPEDLAQNDNGDSSSSSLNNDKGAAISSSRSGQSDSSNQSLKDDTEPQQDDEMDDTEIELDDLKDDLATQPLSRSQHSVHSSRNNSLNGSFHDSMDFWAEKAGGATKASDPTVRTTTPSRNNSNHSLNTKSTSQPLTSPAATSVRHASDSEIQLSDLMMESPSPDKAAQPTDKMAKSLSNVMDTWLAWENKTIPSLASASSTPTTQEKPKIKLLPTIADTTTRNSSEHSRPFDERTDDTAKPRPVNTLQPTLATIKSPTPQEPKAKITAGDEILMPSVAPPSPDGSSRSSTPERPKKPKSMANIRVTPPPSPDQPKKPKSMGKLSMGTPSPVSKSSTVKKLAGLAAIQQKRQDKLKTEKKSTKNGDNKKSRSKSPTKKRHGDYDNGDDDAPKSPKSPKDKLSSGAPKSPKSPKTPKTKKDKISTPKSGKKGKISGLAALQQKRQEKARKAAAGKEKNGDTGNTTEDEDPEKPLSAASLLFSPEKDNNNNNNKKKDKKKDKKDKDKKDKKDKDKEKDKKDKKEKEKKDKKEKDKDKKEKEKDSKKDKKDKDKKDKKEKTKSKKGPVPPVEDPEGSVHSDIQSDEGEEMHDDIIDDDIPAPPLMEMTPTATVAKKTQQALTAPALTPKREARTLAANKDFSKLIGIWGDKEKQQAAYPTPIEKVPQQSNREGQKTSKWKVNLRKVESKDEKEKEKKKKQPKEKAAADDDDANSETKPRQKIIPPQRVANVRDQPEKEDASATKKPYKPPKYKKSKAEENWIKESVKINPAFTGLMASAVKPLVDAFEKIEFKKGSTVAKEGAPETKLFVVQDGEVSFHKRGIQVGTGTAGSTFGEMSLRYPVPRAVEVKAEKENTVLYQLDQKSFRSIMRHEINREEDERTKMLRAIPFFKDADESDLRQLSGAMKSHEFNKDENLTKSFADAPFCLVQEGSLSIKDLDAGDSVGGGGLMDYLMTGGSMETKVGPGEVFGEQVLSSKDMKRLHIQALADGVACTISRRGFEKVFGDMDRLLGKARDKKILSEIKPIKAAKLPEEDLDSLVRQIENVTFEGGKDIFTNNKEMAPALYLVRLGKVEIVKKNGKKEVKTAGDYFGQEYLMTTSKGGRDTVPASVKAKYTATPTVDTVCGILTLEELAALTTTKPKADLEDSSFVPLDDLEHHRILGEGQFGTVWLVTNKKAKKVEPYALKIQQTDDPERTDAVQAIREEVETMKILQCPFIVHVLCTYEDPKTISMLLSLAPGGELFDIIHQEDEYGDWHSGLREETASFYATVVADAMAFMHHQKYIYRDLKPENVLIDQHGYPVITDFGFAKHIGGKVRGKTYTFCGTPQYICPEIASNRGHSYPADNWTMGILIYELILGDNPFYEDGVDHSILYDTICNKPPYYDPDDVISADAKDLIDRLLEKDPSKRLGSFREKDILEHKWLKKYKLSDLRSKRAEAPWIPDPISLEE